MKNIILKIAIKTSMKAEKVTNANRNSWNKTFHAMKPP